MRRSRKFERRGASLELRDIRPDDAERLTAFHAGLSAETKYRRFFAPHPVLTHDEMQRFTCVDGEDRVALVVLEKNTIVAVARYDRSLERPDAAEVAFVVADAWQNEGLGTLLLASLVRIARRHAVCRFTADVLASNTEMMRVFRHAGFDVTTRYDHGVVLVDFAIGKPTLAPVVV